MKRIQLRKTSFHYVNEYANDRAVTLCRSALERLFRIPRYTQRVILCVSKRPHRESYKVEHGKNVVVTLSSGKAYKPQVFGSFQVLVREMSPCYMSIEYEETEP